MILIRILWPGPGPELEKYLLLKASVLKMQTYWRRFKSQKIFKQQRNAVTLLQRQVRRFVSKRKYQRSKAAIVKVQNIYRSKLARREYLKKKLAIVKLQTSNCEEREEQIPWYEEECPGSSVRLEKKTTKMEIFTNKKDNKIFPLWGKSAPQHGCIFLKIRWWGGGGKLRINLRKVKDLVNNASILAIFSLKFSNLQNFL